MKETTEKYVLASPYDEKVKHHFEMPQYLTTGSVHYKYIKGSATSIEIKDYTHTYDIRTINTEWLEEWWRDKEFDFKEISELDFYNVYMKVSNALLNKIIK